METVRTHSIFNLKKAYLFHADVERKQLRGFGIIFFVFFALIIGLSPVVMHRANPRAWGILVGVAFLFLGLVLPKSLKSLYQAWMVFGGILGFINTRILLGLVYFVLITPISLFRRILGKDSLGLRFDPGAKTYRLDLSQDSKLDMTRQF